MEGLLPISGAGSQPIMVSQQVGPGVHVRVRRPGAQATVLVHAQHGSGISVSRHKFWCRDMV